MSINYKIDKKDQELYQKNDYVILENFLILILLKNYTKQ